MKVKCSYCNQNAKIVRGEVVYPMISSVKNLKFWYCAPCHAWVGCHKANRQLGLTGREPLGTLADARLRRCRRMVHDVFDPLWLCGQMTRGQAYRALAKEMGIMVDKCHVAMFDEPLCDRAIEACERLKLSGAAL